jgi:3-dehydroquinate synthase
MPERLLDHMRRDKKVQESRIAFVLVRGIGEAFVTREVPLEDVSRLLQDKLQANQMRS